MTINLAHRPDLDSRVEALAKRLGLRGRGCKTAIIERALAILEARVARERPDGTAVNASLDRYIAAGPHLRARLADRDAGSPPLSQSLQQALYIEQWSRHGREGILRETAGIWRDRSGVPDHETMRAEWDRGHPYRSPS